MGTWGLGDMGFWGHGTEGIHTFRVRHGDMGFRGHGTEGIHTFRVRHGDMGFRGHGTEDIHTFSGDMGGTEGIHTFRVRHGDMTRMKLSEDASSVRRCNLDMNERIVSSIIHQISSTQVHHALKCQSGKARSSVSNEESAYMSHNMKVKFH